MQKLGDRIVSSPSDLVNFLECEQLAAPDRADLDTPLEAPDTEYEGEGIANVYENADIFAGDFQLIAGTAWLFAREELDGALDYLFVDEVSCGTQRHREGIMCSGMRVEFPTALHTAT